jgi:ABC-type molybdate transport system substrate-binding protein
MSEFTADPALATLPFPAALQKPQLYSIGIFAATANGDAARALIAFVTSPAARAKLTAAGVVPAAVSGETERARQ